MHYHSVHTHKGQAAEFNFVFVLCRLYWVHRFTQVLIVIFFVKISRLSCWIHTHWYHLPAITFTTLPHMTRITIQFVFSLLKVVHYI